MGNTDLKFHLLKSHHLKVIFLCRVKVAQEESLALLETMDHQDFKDSQSVTIHV